jgi:hypothetical protein
VLGEIRNSISNCATRERGTIAKTYT